jgi:hypothetical protein
MPTFEQILTKAEAIAVAWQEYEVADAIIAEEPRRYGMVRKLTKPQQEAYDKIIAIAFFNLVTEEYARTLSSL